MARVKLSPLEDYRFSYSTEIRITDLNNANHLGNDSVVSLMHEARARVFNQLNVSGSDLGDGSTGCVQGDLIVNYLMEGFAFEEVEIQIDFTEIAERHFRVCFQFMKDGLPMILAETGMIGFNYKSRKVSALPKSFISAIK